IANRPVIRLGNDLDADDDREGDLQAATAATPAKKPIPQGTLEQRGDAGTLKEVGKVACMPLFLGHEQPMRLDVIELAGRRGVSAHRAEEMSALEPFALLKLAQRWEDSLSLVVRQRRCRIPRESQQGITVLLE